MIRLATLLLLGLVLSASCQPPPRVKTGPIPPFVVGMAMGASGLGDGTYNDMIYKGLVEARADFNIRIWAEASRTRGDYRVRLRQLAAQCRLVFCTEPAWSEVLVVDELAQDYPLCLFVLIDTGQLDLPGNVVDLKFAPEQPSEVAGILASAMSRSQRVALVAGSDVDALLGFIQGFQAGIADGDRPTRLEVVTLSRWPDLSGFSSPALGHSVTTKLVASGVDVVFAVAGGSNQGILQACRESKTWFIGVDSDQDSLAPGLVLTSVMKRLDRAAYEVVAETLVGDPPSGRRVYNYHNGGVSVTAMPFTKHLVPPQVWKKLTQREQEFRLGLRGEP